MTVLDAGDRSCRVQTNITGVPPDAISLSALQISSATASGSYSLTPNGFTADLSVSAAAYPQSTSNARVDFVDTFTTAGPVRTGIASGFFMPSESHYGGGFGWDIDFPGLWPNLNSFGSGPQFTVTLGQEFTVSAYLSARAITDDGTASFASVSTPFYLTFFEADGVTPVALSEVSTAPEPTTLAVAALGLLTLLVARRRLA
ncbi:MAG: PEP-CTERM sorting domain-containing protein [Bryobacteraceae bacterium]